MTEGLQREKKQQGIDSSMDKFVLHDKERLASTGRQGEHDSSTDTEPKKQLVK